MISFPQSFRWSYLLSRDPCLVQKLALCFHFLSKIQYVCWIITLKDEEVGVKESAEDGDKEALTSGSNFERTITVVKGNSSLGLWSFPHVLLFVSIFIVSFFFFLLSLHRSVSEFVRLKGLLAFTFVLPHLKQNDWRDFWLFSNLKGLFHSNTQNLYFKTSPWECSWFRES